MSTKVSVNINYQHLLDSLGLSVRAVFKDVDTPEESLAELQTVGWLGLLQLWCFIPAKVDTLLSTNDRKDEQLAELRTDCVCQESNLCQ